DLLHCVLSACRHRYSLLSTPSYHHSPPRVGQVRRGEVADLQLLSEGFRFRRPAGWGWCRGLGAGFDVAVEEGDVGDLGAVAEVRGRGGAGVERVPDRKS